MAGQKPLFGRSDRTGNLQYAASYALDLRWQELQSKGATAHCGDALSIRFPSVAAVGQVSQRVLYAVVAFVFEVIRLLRVDVDRVRRLVEGGTRIRYQGRGAFRVPYYGYSQGGVKALGICDGQQPPPKPFSANVLGDESIDSYLGRNAL